MFGIKTTQSTRNDVTRIANNMFEKITTVVSIMAAVIIVELVIDVIADKAIAITTRKSEIEAEAPAQSE